MGTGLPWWFSGKRIHLSMQETQIPFLVWEDPTRRGATKSMGHNCWARAVKRGGCNCWSLYSLEPVLCHRKGTEMRSLRTKTREKPQAAMKTCCCCC